MFGDRLVAFVLRRSGSAFLRSCSTDVVDTYRTGCAAVKQDRGRFGLSLHVISELVDLLKAEWRSRFGSPLPITGGVPPPKPASKDRTMRSFVQDFWNAWRRLVREPRAAVGSVLLLALAIGVTSAMFAVVDAFIVRPAPFRDPATIVRLWMKRTSGSSRVDFATARAWRDSGVFDSVFPVVINAMGEFQGPSGLETRSGARITPGTFASLGVAPMMGREFVVGEGREGNERYAILSGATWREMFAADPAIVGKTVQISKAPVQIVGVMPDDVLFPFAGVGVWWPLDFDAPSAASTRTQLLVHARRKPGMPAEETARLATAATSTLPNPGETQLRPLNQGSLDEYSRESIQALAVGVGLVFIVLCANVTNLILARTTARQNEFMVCSALGASRGRLLRQIFLENTAVGICATIIGLGLAYGLVALAQGTLPRDLLRQTLNPLDLDLRAVAATSVAGMIAVLLAGLPPAWFGTRIDASDSVRLTTRGGTDSRASRRLTRSLLVVEVAMAVALLAAAGLQVRSFVNLVNADRGLDSGRVLIANLSLPAAHFADRPSRIAAATAFEDRVQALPGVDGVTIAGSIPPDGGNIHFSFPVQTGITGAAPVTVPIMRSYYVGPEFFSTFGIRIRDGRSFLPDEPDDSAVISQGLARTVYGDRSPIGQAFSFGGQTFRVVGVATEVRNSLSDPREDHPEFYSPLYKASSAGGPASLPGSSQVTIGIRCADPCASMASIRQAIADTSARAEIVSLRPLSDAFLEQLSRPRMAAVVATSFAILALFATAAGLYGVLAYVVSRRQREYGIRSALGAAPSAIRRAVLVDGLKVTSIGVVVGIGAGWMLSRTLGSVQFGVTFFDPATWLVVIAGTLVIAVVASWRPASTAMRVDPSEMLREP